MPWACPECGDDEFHCRACDLCAGCCDCDDNDEFDADELGLDPEEPYDA